MYRFFEVSSNEGFPNVGLIIKVTRLLYALSFETHFILGFRVPLTSVLDGGIPATGRLYFAPRYKMVIHAFVL